MSGKVINVGFIGNPNCGKTTLFNAYTGANLKVANWPGVTVEKKEGKTFYKGQEFKLIDLPGIYSLTSYTMEEKVSRECIMSDEVDVIVDVADASCLERNLYLTLQLIELGKPVVLALNMMDIVKKNGDRIDTKKLSEQLGCEIIETSAVKGEGLKALADCAVKMARSGVKTTPQHTFDQRVEQALSEIASLISDVVPAESLRWYSVKLFERDEKAMERFSFAADTKEHLEQIIAGCEKQFDDDIRPLIHDVVARDDLLKRIGRQAVNAGQIRDNDILLSAQLAFLLLDSDAGPVADILRRSCQIVKHRGFAAVWIACERDLD